MPLSFLAPFFLAGLAALAIPIVVHLIQRERKDAVRFPSLMFLAQVPYKSTRRRKIRNWALFLLRSAVIVLLVTAFSRPFFETDLDASSPLATAREVVILLDRSFSMGYTGRWDRATNAANAAIDALGPDDRGTIVYFDGGAVMANQPTPDHGNLKAVLATARPGAGVTRYGPGFKLAQSVLETSDKPRREVVLISDFQRNGWDGGEGVRLPAGTKINAINVAEGETPNLAVGNVTFRREKAADRERVTATARVVNTGIDPAKGVAVSLELNGREVETKKIDVPANDAATLVFAPFTLAEANQKGAVRVAADALPADDVFHFVLSPGDAISILIADGGGPRASLYLERALAISERPQFDIEVKRADAVRSGDFAGRTVVLWNDATVPPGETGRRLRAFVEGGGGLVLINGPRANWDAAADLVPGKIGAVLDRADPGGALGYIDYSHAIFEIFRAPRSGDLAAARFFRYRPLQVDSTGQVRARFDDGAAALVEKSVGQGRVLLWTSTMDNFWGDLPLQPTFLPFVHQLVRYAGGYAEENPWFTVGQVVDVAGAPVATDDSTATPAAAAPGRERMAIAPSSKRTDLPTGLLRLEESGYYEIRGDARGERIVASNVDLAESELASMDPQIVTAALEPGEGSGPAAAGSARIRPEDRERRQALWWYLLIAAFIILVAETALSNRLSRRRQAR
jgi:hypothetical protein